MYAFSHIVTKCHAPHLKNEVETDVLEQQVSKIVFSVSLIEPISVATILIPDRVW